MSHQHNDITNTKKYKHLSLDERKAIERFSNEGMKPSQIADLLNRHRSTIAREIKKGETFQWVRKKYLYNKNDTSDYEEKKMYLWDVGQNKYKSNRMRCCNKYKLFEDMALLEYIEDKILNHKWSPDSVLGYIKRKGMQFKVSVTTKTLYNYIDLGLIAVRNIDLLLKTKRRPVKRAILHKRQLGRSIDERPAEVDKREDFGHWECDGIVGKNQNGHLLTLVERKTLKGFIFNVEDKKQDKIVKVLDMLQNCFGNKFSSVFKTITFDNGVEFSDVMNIERNGRTLSYYCHPYTSSERGINENYNGIVRRFLPKGTSFENLTEQLLNRINHWIDTFPRKKLGYKNAQELFNQELSAIMT